MTYCNKYDIIYTERTKESSFGKEVKKMKRKKTKKKLTAYEITEIIIEAVVAIAALITAIKWW